jgi:hypothetical protein
MLAFSIVGGRHPWSDLRDRLFIPLYLTTPPPGFLRASAQWRKIETSTLWERNAGHGNMAYGGQDVMGDWLWRREFVAH